MQLSLYISLFISLSIFSFLYFIILGERYKIQVKASMEHTASAKKGFSDDRDRVSGLCPCTFSDRAGFGDLQKVVRLGRGELEDK